MKKNKKWWIIIGVLLGILALFLIAKKAGWIDTKKPIEVEFAKVSRANMTETVSASGKIQPELEVKITPDVSGEIIALYVKEGDSVKKGQLLLKIKPENYASIVERFSAGVNQSRASAEQSNSAIARAESQLLKAQLDFKRQSKLYEEKVISEAEFETSQANMKMAKQDLASAKANYEAANYGIKSSQAALKDAAENLRKTNIYAPMSGIVSKLNIETGERVVGTSQMAGTEIMRIADLSNMEVRVNVNENDIIRVSLSDTVIVDVDAYTSSGKKFKGLVTQIANTANGQNSTLNAAASSTDAVTEFEVRVRILPSSYQNLGNIKGHPFKPGMTATVEIVTATKQNVLSVPISSITTRSKNKVNAEEKTENEEEIGAVKIETAKEKPKEIVFIHENGKAIKREVSTGITDTVLGTIEILKGLKSGEEIIVGPFLEVSKKLNDGDKVIKLKDEKPIQ